MNAAGGREAAVSLDATVKAYDTAYGLLTLRVDGGGLLVPAPPIAARGRQRLRIAASDVSLARAAPQASSILNALPARIVAQSAAGPGEVIVVLALGPDGRGARLLARITLRSWALLELAVGMDIFAQIKGVSLVSARNGSDGE
jgi:molybdate transport system ATP-binding protein